MKTIIITGIIFLLTGFIFRNKIAAFFSTDNKKQEKHKGKKEKDFVAGDVTIKEKWDLPGTLIEISGIAYIDRQRFACVQDEAGTIFIYNTADNKIEKEIPFTGPGDFEGITLNGNTAYIVRSDGVIFEVDMMTKKTNQYPTFLTAENNVESLFYDAPNNRLLLAGKEPDEAHPGFKYIYAFDLAGKSLLKEPVLKIDLSNEAFATTGKPSKKKKGFMPSALAVHPVNNDIYVLDGPKSRLLLAQQNGTIKKVYELGSDFFKPEGISFSPSGDLFISNEGKKMAANIMEVNID